jgi:hypothetical protein
MSDEPLAFHQQSLRGTDSNSLLRLYDQVRAALGQTAFRGERAKADRALRRIARELAKRKVPLGGVARGNLP